MPNPIWVLLDTQTNKFLTVADSTGPEDSQWSSQYAEHFEGETQGEVQVNTIISGWGYTPGQRYIGSNPQTPPPKPPGS